ncbi:hypothetical protein GCM10022403_083300 [Streptomyces coacervatus]|uniref:Uncharacterized protein n=1 Tax=Streptomyces coacervatus TaxID=647381 RepID=A0ABP7J917_9ACTN|nr:hypothetical protein [Streptomyces coacervatus]MDF2270312.1 hypothetical protein [Streptomyces coacervatus]
MKTHDQLQSIHYSAWVPVEGASAVAAGEWWDAVRVEAGLGIPVVHYFRALSPDRLGPVIADPDMRIPSLYFLIPPGTAADWAAPGSRGLGRNCYVVVPNLCRTAPPGAYWLVRPQYANRHTDPESLRRFLDTAAA